MLNSWAWKVTSVAAVRPAGVTRVRKCNACSHKKGQPFATLFGPPGQVCRQFVLPTVSFGGWRSWRSVQPLNVRRQRFDILVAQLRRDGAHDLGIAVIGAVTFTERCELFLDVISVLPTQVWKACRCDPGAVR